MNSNSEREGFSRRLQLALRSAAYSSDSPTQLAREFNIRFDGRAVTVHAARKWLVGESIPTQEKIRVLANWLGVTADWLRFGGPENSTGVPVANASPFPAADIHLIADLQRLDEHDKTIAREFIRMLVRMSGRK